MTLPAEGQPAPDFTMPADGGAEVTLSALTGQRVVIFAYGQDGTPTCTNEVREFQALHAEFAAAGVALFGLSKDRVAAHDRFKAKEALTLALLSDHGGQMMERWGAFGEKLFFGKMVTGVLRTTFLIGTQGRLERIWKVDRVKGHAAEVLAAVTAKG